jgi:hypothetical protein
LELPKSFIGDGNAQVNNSVGPYFRQLRPSVDVRTGADRMSDDQRVADPLAAGAAVFAEKGYKPRTMTEIASRAGAPPTLKPSEHWSWSPRRSV